jgi:hypothetical protein
VTPGELATCNSLICNWCDSHPNNHDDLFRGAIVLADRGRALPGPAGVLARYSTWL